MSLKSFLFITFIGLLGMFSGCAQVSEHIVGEPAYSGMEPYVAVYTVP